MSHLAVAPIVIPLIAGALLLAIGAKLHVARAVSGTATLAVMLCALLLAAGAHGGEHLVYALGNWPAPFGIVLVVDRLSALMLVLTAGLGLAAVAYAMAGWDARAPHFHALFQFQLLGLNGAFLTGDLFNLFVFFEVLLISSYCLLLHGLGPARVRAAVHYVVVNLAASGMFLVAVSLLYGVTGTLNMAHLSERAALAGPGDRALIHAAGLLLLSVFGIKAAVFPLYFWLPSAYAAASAPVAALFAIMTKVGVYAIVRVSLLVFGSDDITAPWLLPVALITLGLGTLGALGAQSLGVLIAYLTINSVGTMLTGVAIGGAAGLAASLYYLAHSVLALGALFLLAEAIGRQRGDAGDALRAAHAVLTPATLGLAFLLAAAMVAGIPPLSGFLGKLMLLSAVRDGGAQAAVWATVLVTSLLSVIACARAGSILFWKQVAPHPSPPAPRARMLEVLPLAGLLAAGAGLAVLAAPITRYTEETAMQLLTPDRYISAVLDRAGDREPRPLPHEARP